MADADRLTAGAGTGVGVGEGVVVGAGVGVGPETPVTVTTVEAWEIVAGGVPSNAVIVAVPGLTPTTAPDASNVATEGFDEVHCWIRLVRSHCCTALVVSKTAKCAE